MPAANHTPPVFRINSTGLAHVDGTESSTSSMRKSPLGSSGTPARGVLCSTNGAAGSQISVANTLWFAFWPMELLLASRSPRPRTLMRPSTSTSARRSAMRHGPAPGGTPRTTFSLTFGSVPSGLAGPAPLAAGMTPMPPSKRTSRSRARAPTDPTIVNRTRMSADFFMFTVSLHFDALHAPYGRPVTRGGGYEAAARHAPECGSDRRRWTATAPGHHPD